MTRRASSSTGRPGIRLAASRQMENPARTSHGKRDWWEEKTERARAALDITPGRSRRKPCDPQGPGRYRRSAMPDDSKTPLSKERRQEVFHALVQAQDGGASVEDSRRHTARLFDISTAEVRRIEREGLDACWPPLA